MLYPLFYGEFAEPRPLLVESPQGGQSRYWPMPGKTDKKRVVFDFHLV
jgi:hypothetical protein